MNRRSRNANLFSQKSAANPSPKMRASMYSTGAVHTIELPDLLNTLRAHQGDWMRAVSRVSDDWNGNMSYSEALDAAQLGQWNAPKIPALTIPELVQVSDDVEYFYDVTGHYLDVPTFCSNQPDCWLVEEPIYKTSSRVIRLAVEIGGLGDVSASELENRGRAIIALVHSLELQGHSVEVTMVRAFGTNEGTYKFLVPIKHAGLALDIKRFQFIIGHPAFYRRCLFGLSELARGLNMAESGGTFTEEYKPEGYIHIGHKQGLSTYLDASMAWAKQFALTIAAAEN